MENERSRCDQGFGLGVCLLLSASVSFAVLFMQNGFRAVWPWFVIIGGWVLVLLVQALETGWLLIRSLFSWRNYWKRFLSDVLLTLILITPFVAIGIYIQRMMFN